MSNLVGIDFFRLVSESSVNDWAQVYARVPFEEDEVKKKGALFGAIRLKGEEDLVGRGTEIFSSLDEYFNKIEEGGDLKGLVEKMEEKEKDLEAVWVWVSLEKGKQIMRLIGIGGGKIEIIRGGERLVLVGEERQGKVIKGELKEGDRVIMGVGEVVDLVGRIGEETKLEEVVEELKKKMEDGNRGAMAGLLLEVGGLKRDEKEDSWEEDEKEEVVVKEEDVGEEKEIEEKESEEVEISDEKMAGVRIDGEGKVKRREWLKRKKRGIKVKEGKGKERKLLLLGGVFMCLFLVSVGVGSIRMRRKKVEEAWLAVVEPWQKKEEEALALVEVNPVGARELLRGVLKEVEEKESDYVGGKYEDDFKEVKTSLEESWKKVSGESEAKTTTLTSLDLLRSGLKGERLVKVDEERVLVVDEEKGLVVEVVLEDKGMKVLLGKGEGKGWKDVAGNEDTVVVMGEEGLVYETGGSEGELEFDGSVLAAVGVEMFAGNVYVLDGGAEEIWKFGVSGGELEERVRWLSTGEELGVSGVVDMDIDGDVWILGSGGEVSRLRRGYRESYSLSGGPEDLKGDRLVVSSEGETLMVLDRTNSRLVEFEKETGEYVRQLVGEKIGKTEDVIITEEGRLLGMAEGELFYIE